MKFAKAFDRALVAYKAENLRDAERLCRRVIAAKRNHFDALHMLAIVQSRLGKKEESLSFFDRALALQPDHPEVLSNLSNTLRGLNRLEEALAGYKRVQALKPNFADAYSNCGLVLHDLKRFDEALASNDEALRLRPNSAEAYNNRGNALHALKRYDEALASYDKSLSIRPNYVEALNNRGNALKELDRLEEALVEFDRALALNPNHVTALYNRGITLGKLLRLDEALASYGKAVAIQPDHAEAHWNEALIRLVVGDFDRGWKKYEWRWKNEAFTSPNRNFPQPLWLGEGSIKDKTILLHAEQGYGDTIQFCRFAPLVAAQGARVVLEVPRALRELMADISGVAQIVCKGDPLPEFDTQCPFLSLPLALGTRLESIPSATPYLHAPSSAVKRWTERLGSKSRPRIGLCWTGNPAHKNDHNRSIDLLALLPLLDVDATFVSLQRELRPEDEALMSKRGDILQFGTELKDFSDTAALISELDLVIAVDTSVAHLAGALGKPVWLLLPFIPDWRWLLDRTDSPWYPTARLFRQDKSRDWGGVVKQVHAALSKFVSPAHPQTQSTASEVYAKEAYANASAAFKAENLAEARRLCQQVIATEPDHLGALHLLAIIDTKQGHKNEALAHYEKVLSLQAGRADLYYGRANVLKSLGRIDEALLSFDCALAIRPDYVEPLYNRANTLRELGRFEEALASYDRVLAVRPEFAGALNNRGLVLHELKRFEEAAASYERALKNLPQFPDALNNLGNALQSLHRFDEALSAYDRAISIQANFPEALNNRGNALKQLNRLDEALEDFTTACAIRQNYTSAHNNRGVVRLEQKHFEQSLACFEQALSISPDHAEAHYNRGNALRELKRFDEALASFNRALEVRPDYAEAYSNRGHVLHLLNRFADELASYERALAIKPDFAEAHWNNALSMLLTGDFERGWREYEWRWKNVSLELARTDLTQTRWYGADAIEGKTILIHAEQGYGDTIQFSRYVKLVAERGARVVLEVPTALRALMADLPGVTQVVCRGDPLPKIDLQCPLLSLPLAFGTRLETIPSTTPYLQAPAGLAQRWAQRLGPKRGPRIGLCWTGSTRHKNDHNRSIGLQALLPLLDLDATFVSLQKELRPDDQTVLSQHVDILQFGAELKDFSDTAALISQLDLVISVDTSVAHLAGALGKPVWLLLPFLPDWRWLLDREDSPWYPNARLFRQDATWNWGAVITRVHAAMREFIASNSSKQPLTWPAEFDRAFAAFKAENLPEAERLCHLVIADKPDHFDALHMLGVVQARLGRNSEALTSYDRALAVRPDHTDVVYNRASLLRTLGAHAEALTNFDRVLVVRPDHVEALYGRANALKNLGRFEEALASYDKGIALKPDYAELQLGGAICLLTMGNFDRGWEKYEWRWDTNHLSDARRTYPQPRWQGADAISGKTILLYNEQGYGDTIQFCRYVPLIAKRGARVILECQKPLRELMANLTGVTQAICKDDPLPEFDMHCPMLSLPMVFGTKLETIPAAIPYLQAPLHAMERWGERLGRKRRPRIGLCWAGSPEHKNDLNRSVGVRSLLPLLDIDATFIGLHRDVRVEDVAVLKERKEISYFGAELKDFSDTAALISELDLVISVDTGVAHLAGALGKPVWLLLPFTPDWRWLLNREDSPWYPTARLFRQIEAHAWDDVVDRVRAALDEFVRLSSPQIVERRPHGGSGEVAAA